MVVDTGGVWEVPLQTVKDQGLAPFSPPPGDRGLAPISFQGMHAKSI